MRAKSSRSISSQVIHRCGSGQDMPTSPLVAGAKTGPMLTVGIGSMLLCDITEAAVLHFGNISPSIRVFDVEGASYLVTAAPVSLRQLQSCFRSVTQASRVGA